MKLIRLYNIFINITAIDRCKHVDVSASTANFRPSRLVTVVTNSPVTGTHLSTITASNSGPGEFYNIVIIINLAITS